MVRAKKKQKRLDAIVDSPTFPPSPSSDALRRSSRVRRAPVVLDSSPVPSSRKKRPRIEDSSPATPNSRGSSNRRSKEVIVRKAISFDPTCRDSEGVNLRTRQRPNGETKLKRRKKKKSKFSSNRKRTVNCPVEISPVVDRDDVSLDGEEGARKNEKSLSDLNFLQEELNEDNSKEEVLEVKDTVLEAKDTTENENLTSKDQIDDLKEDQDPIPTQQIEGNVAGEKSDEKIACEKENVSKVNEDAMTQSDIKEGRRCGLCGCGTDGRPPKILVRDLNAPHESSDKEAYEGLSGSEETNYDVWDGFGDEPGWLGRLLGPIRDQFGITRIWVHQNCAVWSPEVYFAGAGYLKSVRAALYRGKALKCSRCGRPGATIGCRVDRCPKTYHLPCSRAEGCIFDHRKFLIACNYHRHLFEPRGDERALHLRKLKRKKLWADLKKCSDEARRKDLDAEEKWLENCGEDEEFLRRESKRLQRDLLRIAPTFIGGSCNSNQSSEGWESIAGLQDVIRCMKEVVILPLLYPEVFHSLSLTPPRGVLLHGHPGTGKTLVVRALIGACSRSDKKIAYFARKGADCLGKYVGDAERQLRLLFQVAEKSQPSIIFFDEIDGLAPCRSRRQDQTHNSVVATLLSLMDGLKSRGSVVVIGATNRPDAVDPALRRPGRFDREIYFPLPTCEERSAILSLHTKKWPSPMSGSFLSFVANQTVGYAGADLRSVCTQAAINALKRQCPLSDILSLAEKGLFGQSSGPPALPQISVDEKDWLLALASAPPPCSRREAGAAANEVITSPLESHLVPCLLKPLCQFLVWLSLDERVWLPSSLLKMSAMVKGFIFSDMERNNVPTALWLTHIYSLIEKRDVANELVKVLTMYGIITSSMGVDLGIPSGDVNSNKIDMSGTERSATDLKNSFMYSKSTGFRVVIGGPQRSGQQRLASCLLQAFLGQIDIHKVNLATMSQEGNGDIISGLTQILMRCLNNGRCIIYMPRMDLWAIEKAQKEGSRDDKDDNGSSKAGELAQVSEVWSTFLEQVDSARTSMSTIILATSDIQLHELPVGIMQFFNAGAACQSNAHTIPRFSVNLDGTLNHSEVINSFSSRLSYDLVMHYIQLAHQSAHNAVLENPLQFQLPSKTEMETKINKVSLAPSEEVPSTVLKKPAKSNIMTGAIWSFGYQILRNPQFSELCWVTSKLREGPSTNTIGPWKGWPFNSCVVRNNSAAGVAKEKQKDQDDTVRGLVAVGLMAYRGVYGTPYDLCCDVRKVLELLAQKIRVRVSRRRGPYRYFRVLTQAAYLDDMVLNWAYSFQRSYGDIKIPPSCPTPVGEKPCNDNCASQGNPSAFQQSAAKEVQDEACGKALEGDVVQITNEVAKECSIPTATEDRMEVDPRVNEPVSDCIDKLLTDPSIEKQHLSPPIDEPASSETLEQHSLKEGILKESQNPSPENGVAEPTTLSECSTPTATEESIGVDPQVDKLVSDPSDELVTNPSIEKQPLSPSINEPATSKTQEQHSLTAGISKSQNHPESEGAELTTLTECSLPTVTEERMDVDSRVDEPVSRSIDEPATDPPIEKQPLSPPINEPASSKTQEQHSFADAILKESQNQSSENGVAELTTLTECSIPTATEDRMEVDPRVVKPVSGFIDELATDPSIEKQSASLPFEETTARKTQDEHTLTEANSKSENPISENRVTELTTLTETQEQYMVTESLPKDSPMLTCERDDTEPVIVENQDPSTSAEFFESVSVLRKKDSCIYICCSKCFHEVHAAVHQEVLKFWTSHDSCSTIEDMHDILSSYGLHLVSTLSKRHASKSRNQGDAVHLNSCQCHKMVSGNAMAPQECECHMSNGKEGEDITLRFLFRDGVLMPMHLSANVDGTEALHCSLKRLCVCPVLDRVGFL